MPRATLSTVSLAHLLAEVERRKAKLKTLIAERSALDAQIAEIEAAAGTAPAAKEKKA